MKVIGAGFGRTGTRSLKDALELLGFDPCYHMHELFEHPEHTPVWLGAQAGQTVDWDQIFAGYQATVDWPGAAFYAQFMEAYPDAPVLLSVRDPERWYESCLSTIYGSSRSREKMEGPEWPPARVINSVIWQGTFHGRFEDKEYAIGVFQRHIEEVKERVPADKLLVYDVKQGWEPLCRFLQVDVPDTPFPYLNTREEWQQRAAAE